VTKIGKGGLKEFKEFALKGSVSTWHRIILGVAFGKIISSFVDTYHAGHRQVFAGGFFEHVRQSYRHALDSLAAAKSVARRR